MTEKISSADLDNFSCKWSEMLTACVEKTKN